MNQHFLQRIILVFGFVGCSFNETSSPLNHAVDKGTKVRLNCSNENNTEVKWRFANLSNVYTIYENRTDEKFKDLFSINDSVKGHFDLSFTASAETAGMYICAAVNASLDPFSTVQVTVLDASPTCSGEETSGFVNATCTISFRGFWSPVLEWVNEKGKLDPTETVTIPNKNVTISLSMPFKITEVGTTFRFTCTAKFTLENMPAGTTETNIPDFTKSCSSEIKPSGSFFVEQSTPLNYAVLRGTVVQLNCSAPINDSGYWTYTNPSFVVQNQEQIYSGNGVIDTVKDLFSIDESLKGRFHLVIKEASERTSGRYTCIRGHDKNSPQYSAQVIVLDAKPICSEEESSGFVRATCRIGFSGYWPPDLEWRNAHGRLIPNDTLTTPHSSVTSFLVLPFRKTDPKEVYILTCTPKFTRFNKPQNTSAENIPEFPHSCKTEPPVVDKELSPDSTEPPNPSIVVPSSSAFVSFHSWHYSYLCLCLVTLVFIRRLHK